MWMFLRRYTVLNEDIQKGDRRRHETILVRNTAGTHRREYIRYGRALRRLRGIRNF